MRSGARLLAAGASLFALGMVVGPVTGVTFAAFSGTTSNGSNSVTAKHIFPGDRTTSVWNLHDASSGTESSTTIDPIAFVDATVYTTGNWTSAFSSTRYEDVNLNGPLPAGLSVSSPQFSYTFAANAGADTACFYFEVYNGASLIGTHGSSGSPAGCVTGTTQTTVNTTISEVTTTDVANSLVIRAYMRESAGKPIKIDAATVTGTFSSTGFTLYRDSLNDQSTGTANTTIWGPAAASDGAVYTSAANWATAFATTRFLKFTFPAYVPSGAVISSVTFNHSYKGNNSGDTACYYFEVYNSASLIGTHGSSGSPVSCNSTTSFVTDNVSLSEVDTVTEANNLVIKLYMRNSGTHRIQTDLATVTINYYLD